MAMKDISNDKEFVLTYLRQLGIKPAKNIRQFWNYLDNRHEKEVLDPLDLAMKDRYEGKGSIDLVYKLKNINLQLSLDTANFSADLFRRYFDWLQKRKGKKPKRVLHIGCDNAIITGYLANRFPDSEIIGIDVDKNAVKCAQELVRQLRLPNVTILHLNLWDIEKHFPSHSFDLILTLRSLHQFFRENQAPPRHWSTKDLLEMEIRVDDNHIAYLLKDLLRDQTSELITCEGFANLGALAMWAKILERAGLTVNWNKADYLSFHEVGEEQRLPILPITKAASTGELLEKLYHFETKNKPIHLNPNETFIEPAAEILFHQINNKEFVYGLQIKYNDDSGIMRLEVWKTADQLLAYQYSNIGFRELKCFDLQRLPDLIEELQTVAPSYTPFAQTFFYENLEQRKYS